MMNAVRTFSRLYSGHSGREIFQPLVPLLHRFSRSHCSTSTEQFGNYDGAKQLGKKVDTPVSPFTAKLDRVPNAHQGSNYIARFVCPEFTSLCPVTSQPDFAHIVIDYLPNEWLLESKSLKLYLQSYRNHGDFHEACTVAIAKRITHEINPKWLRIGAYWFPRGGIPIDVFYQTADPPPGVWIPEQSVPGYRGRG
uniref:NADPH-dependent nitrile oxidoreductase n=1 Tax=Timspurckia oligopyrenoides TaxID=708627 RepID=A0A7S0ZDP6_9RHOD|mmetsp:Transcript_1384/g.2519  ORF Transcript_1384/g.2519 Transcript_1384/m.2519 type:complete len:195 (+) Transcript_1384:106-690(+)